MAQVRKARRIPGFSTEQSAALFREFSRRDDVDADLARKDAAVTIYTETTVARAGQFLRVSPDARGMTVLLPAADRTLPGSRVTISIEAPAGTLAVACVPGEFFLAATVNGERRATFTDPGMVELVCNGASGWATINQLPQESAPPPGVPSSDGPFVVTTPDPDLPAARVLSDGFHTTIDQDTPGEVQVDWTGIDTQEQGVSLGLAHTINAAGSLDASLAAGVLTLTAGGKDIDVTIGGANDPYLLPSTFVSGDRLRITLSSNATVTRIFDSAGNPLPDNTTLILSLFDAGGASTFSLQLVDTSANNAGRIRTPGAPASAGANENYVMASHEEGCYLVTGASSGGVSTWRVVAGTAAQAITGAVSVAAGDGGSRASTFSGIRDNGSLETARGFLNLVSSTSVTLTGTQDAGNDEIEVTAQRAALTGFAEAAANSNATTSAEPLVTYSASGNMSAERVVSDGLGTVVDIATAGQIKLNLVTQTNGGAIIAHRVTFSASGVTGTKIDVTIWNANVPFALRILEAQLRLSVAGGTTAELRTATAGGGAVILPDAATATQTFTTATTGRKNDNAAATALFAANDTIILRIDRACTGEVVLFYRA